MVNTMSILSWLGPEGMGGESSCSRKPHCAVHTSSCNMASRLASRSSCPQSVILREAHCACNITCEVFNTIWPRDLPHAAAVHSLLSSERHTAPVTSHVRCLHSFDTLITYSLYGTTSLKSFDCPLMRVSLSYSTSVTLTFY